MFGEEVCDFSFWWVFPILMMVLYLFIMSRSKNPMMCGFVSCHADNQKISASESAIDILDNRYSSGEIDKDEYEERKRIPIE